MSILRSKSDVLLLPSFSSTTIEISISFSDGTAYDGDFLVCKLRTYANGRYEYQVATDADSYENITPDILDLSEWPLVKRVEGATEFTGIMEFTKISAKIRRTFAMADQGLAMGSIVISESILSGTVLSHTHNLVWSAATAVGKSPYYYRTIGGSGVSMGSNWNTVQPNPDCWLASWDFSGVPIWNSNTNSPAKGGGLVTNRHLLEAGHYSRPVGTVLKFMAPDGSVTTKTVIGESKINTTGVAITDQKASDFVGDLRILTLDSAVPAEIKVYPVAGDWSCVTNSVASPETASPWKARHTVQAPVAGIWLNRFRSGKFAGNYRADTVDSNPYQLTDVVFNGTEYDVYCDTVGYTGAIAGTTIGDAVTANTYHGYGEGGDSGSPNFIPLTASTMALYMTFWTPGGGSRPEPVRVNALIASADADAVARGNLGTATGLTVTVAPDPTL